MWSKIFRWYHSEPILFVSNDAGTGGNNHAVEHFEQTGFPLCVKLGTITADGAGDLLRLSWPVS